MLTWGLYASAAAWQTDWFHWGTEPTASTIYTYLAIAVVMTIACAVVTYNVLRQTAALLQRGVKAHAVVAKIGGMATHSVRPVTLAYTVQGRQYTVRRDLADMYVTQFTPSTRIPVLYDPQHPEQCEILDVGNAVASPGGSWMGGLADALRKPLVAVLYVANAVVLYGLMRLMAGEGSVWMMSIMLGAGALTGLEEELIDRLTRGDNPLYSARLRRGLTIALAAGAILFALINVRSQNHEIERQRQADIEREQRNQQLRAVTNSSAPDTVARLQQLANERKSRSAGQRVPATNKDGDHP